MIVGGSVAGSAAPSPCGSPRLARRDPSILKGGSFKRREAVADRDPPAVTFNVENENSSDEEGQITFSVRPRPAVHYRPPAAPPASCSAPPPAEPRSRPSSLLMAGDDTPDARLAARSRSVEDSSRAGVGGSPVIDLKLRGLRKTAAILRKVSSAERLTRFKDKILSRSSGSRDRSPAREDAFSDDESVPLVSPPSSALHLQLVTPLAPSPPPLGVSVASLDAPASSELSPRSDLTELESPREPDASFDMMPELKPGAGGGGGVSRADSAASLGNMVEPYNLRLLAHGAGSAGVRALWRQDALDSDPPWPWDEPDSPV